MGKVHKIKRQFWKHARNGDFKKEGRWSIAGERIVVRATNYGKLYFYLSSRHYGLFNKLIREYESSVGLTD